MKEWVKWFLLQENLERLDKQKYADENESGQAITDISEELEDEEEVYDQLTYYFRVDFGGSALNDPSDYMNNAFGSVLADLPEEVFKTLSKMENVFFTFTSRPGAEVKCFTLGADFKEGNELQIVTLPYASAFLPLSATRGEIAHELAHIYAGHKGRCTDEMRDKANEIAESWGFRHEIEAYRQYLTAQERTWGLKEKLKAYKAYMDAYHRKHVPAQQTAQRPNEDDDRAGD